MSNSILEISSKQELLDKINFIQSMGVFANENLADVLLLYYVEGDLRIPDMTLQDIYFLCMEIYCEQVRQGAINSKFRIAQQLANLENKYIQSDNLLSEFLIHIASCENSSGACMIIAKKFFESGREELGYFWQRKSMNGTINKIGIKLNLNFDQINKTIILLD